MRSPVLLTLLALLVTLPALAQELPEEHFDFDRTIVIVYILEDRYVITGRPGEYNPSNHLNLIFEAIYPYVHQLERTPNHYPPDFNKMLVEYKLRLITPAQHKTYYFGSRWLATETKVVPITIEDYLQIQDTLMNVRPDPGPYRGQLPMEQSIEDWTNQFHEHNANELVTPFPEYAGWDSGNRVDRIEAIRQLDNSDLYFFREESFDSNENELKIVSKQGAGLSIDNGSADRKVVMQAISSQKENFVDEIIAETKTGEYAGSNKFNEPNPETNNGVSVEKNNIPMASITNIETLIFVLITLFGLSILTLYLYSKQLEK